MWTYDKKLEFPVKIKNPDPRAAKIIISQLGGPDGEIGAAMRYLNKQNVAPSIENYEILYRGNLPEGKRSVPQAELLEQLYQKFNFARPTDYHGHSLSVSDVIMLNQDGKISAHYVDSIGFKELPGFLDKKPERTSVLQTLKEKCDAPECNPTVCRKVRDAHEL